MNCLSHETIVRYLEGDLREDKIREVDRHVNSCGKCKKELESAAIVVKLLKSAGLVEPPVYMLRRGQSLVPNYHTPWRTARYHLVVIGRSLRSAITRRLEPMPHDLNLTAECVIRLYGELVEDKLAQTPDTCALIALLMSEILSACEKNRGMVQRAAAAASYVPLTKRLRSHARDLAFIADEVRLIDIARDVLELCNELPPVWTHLSQTADRLFAALEEHDLSSPVIPDGLTPANEKRRKGMVENVRRMMIAFCHLVGG